MSRAYQGLCVLRLEDGSEVGVLNRCQIINDFASQTENLDFFPPESYFWKIQIGIPENLTCAFERLFGKSMNNPLLAGGTRGDDPISRLLM